LEDKEEEDKKEVANGKATQEKTKQVSLPKRMNMRQHLLKSL
jgi:hypothetical protein